jgi:hypothetical protein
MQGDLRFEKTRWRLVLPSSSCSLFSFIGCPQNLGLRRGRSRSGSRLRIGTSFDSQSVCAHQEEFVQDFDRHSLSSEKIIVFGKNCWQNKSDSVISQFTPPARRLSGKLNNIGFRARTARFGTVTDSRLLFVSLFSNSRRFCTTLTRFGSPSNEHREVRFVTGLWGNNRRFTAKPEWQGGSLGAPSARTGSTAIGESLHSCRRRDGSADRRDLGNCSRSGRRAGRQLLRPGRLLA